MENRFGFPEYGNGKLEKPNSSFNLWAPKFGKILFP